jgi:hypothetical protein
VCAATILDDEVEWRVIKGKKYSERATDFLKECAQGRAHSEYGEHAAMATCIVAEAFEKSPNTARSRLREKWLPQGYKTAEVVNLANEWLAPIGRKRVLIWNRCRRDYRPRRNTTAALREQLCQLARDSGLCPIIVGSPISDPRSSENLTALWEVAGLESHMSQLAFYDHLQSTCNVVASVGNLSAAMDGSALLGLPTMYLERRPGSPRMEKWIDVVPNYTRAFLNVEGRVDREDEVARWLKACCAPDCRA